MKVIHRQAREISRKGKGSKSIKHATKQGHVFLMNLVQATLSAFEAVETDQEREVILREAEETWIAEVGKLNDMITKRSKSNKPQLFGEEDFEKVFTQALDNQIEVYRKLGEADRQLKAKAEELIAERSNSNQ